MAENNEKFCYVCLKLPIGTSSSVFTLKIDDDLSFVDAMDIIFGIEVGPLLQKKNTPKVVCNSCQALLTLIFSTRKLALESYERISNLEEGELLIPLTFEIPLTGTMEMEQNQETQVSAESHPTKESVATQTEQKVQCSVSTQTESRSSLFSGHVKSEYSNLKEDLAKPKTGRVYVKSFARSGDMYTHTNPKPFCCKICQATFRTASKLKLHLASHYAEKSIQKTGSTTFKSHLN